MKHQHFFSKASLKLLEVSVFVKVQLGARESYIAAGAHALALVLIGKCCVSGRLASVALAFLRGSKASLRQRVCQLIISTDMNSYS